MGNTMIAPCDASADMGSMHGDSDNSMPCKNMCAVSINCVSLVTTPSYDLDLAGKLSAMLVRRSPLVTLPNGLVVEPRPTPPIYFA